MSDQHVVTIGGIEYVRTNGYRSHLSEVTRLEDYPSVGKSTIVYVPGGRMIYWGDERHPDRKR